MNARELIRRRVVVAEDAFADIVVWEVPRSVPGCTHEFKYRLAFVVAGVCVLRYDNEVGKGDHRHLGPEEMPYTFSTPRKLVADFLDDIRRWRDDNRDA